MTSIDTNVLFYALAPNSARHGPARELLETLSDGRTRVVMCELVLAELYNLLRNPAVMQSPLSTSNACDIVQSFRHHPHWQLVESAPVMEEVWAMARQAQFARRRLYDLRLALTLQHHGVRRFITANRKDFLDTGFDEILDPFG